MKADIIACYPTTWLSKVIQFFTGKDITHVAIQITDTLIMETSAFGIKLAKLSIYDSKCRVYTCPTLTQEQRENVIKYAMNRVDEPYDYPLLFGIGINIILKKLHIHSIKTHWDNPNKDICVELIVDAYRSVGIDLLPDYNDEELVPAHITNSRLLQDITR